MKRPFSPLVWLCAAASVALGALAIYDPSGVYAGYVASLDRDTPVIAAVFTAAQDGVYPWTTPAQADELPRSPAYRPLTETVTDEEMRSSVGNDEPFSETIVFTPSVETVTPAGTAEDDAVDGVQDDAPSAGFVTVDTEWFNDALFIGDSHTEGLCDYGGLSNATYYFKRGLDVWSVMTKPFVGGKQTIPQALETRQFGKIYIMLGINEIGCGTTESFAEQYGSVVAQLRELQPDALIYIQAIFHTSQKKSESSVYNNDTINARNAAIAALADGEHIFFVDCNAVFDDEHGTLTPAYSGDGVHVKAPYYTMWRDYLCRFGFSGIVTGEKPAPVPEAPPAPVSAPEAVKPAAQEELPGDEEETPSAISVLPEGPAVPIESLTENAEPVTVPESGEPLPDAPVPTDPTIEPASDAVPADAPEAPEGVSAAAAEDAAPSVVETAE